MTAPHPGLLVLVAGGDVGSIASPEAFLRSALEHRLTAVVVSAVHEGRVVLPEASATTLAVWELAEVRQHLLFWQTIEEVKERLAPLGAEIIVLKGVATEARWYDEVGQRTCTDVDLLLAPHDLDRVAEVVGAIDPGRGSSAAIGRLVRRRLLQHVDLRVGAVQVDLHFDPLKVGLPTLQLDEVWTSSEELETPYGTIRVLRPEIELVLFLLHLNKDQFALLGPFLDIRQILDRGSLDWAYLRAFVTAEGLDVPVWKSLGVVAEVLAMELDVPTVGGTRGWTWDRLWKAGARLQGDEGRDRATTVQPLLALHATGRIGDQGREIRRQLLPPRSLLEVAGRLEPERSYLRQVTFDRLARRQPHLLRRARMRLSRDPDARIPGAPEPQPLSDQARSRP